MSNFKYRPINGNNPLTLTIANHFLYYPTPKSLNYSWSFGSLAGLFFALQIVTGIFLAMHYTPNVDLAFASVEHIMTDVTGGYLFRYFHANGASMIFILIYLHIGRNLYYQSYVTRPVLWNTGIVIFLLMMATAFIGYVLPWGQMSFWGATVITSLVTAVPVVGEAIAHWVWGGFSISNATLVRFYALHFTLPFIVLGIIAGHLVALHTSGSSDPLTLALTPGKLTFHPYFTLKDAFIFFVVFAFFAALVCFEPNLLGHSDNFIPANPLVTPAHIVPEWYFTPFYAILRSCPNKLGGALGMFAAILLLLAVPTITASTSPDARIIATVQSLPHRIGVWFFGAIFLTLMYLGMRPAEAPYVVASKIFTVLYFTYFLVFIPSLTWLSRQLLNTTTATLNKKNSNSNEYKHVSFPRGCGVVPRPLSIAPRRYLSTTPGGEENPRLSTRMSAGFVSIRAWWGRVDGNREVILNSSLTLFLFWHGYIIMQQTAKEIITPSYHGVTLCLQSAINDIFSLAPHIVRAVVADDVISWQQPHLTDNRALILWKYFKKLLKTNMQDDATLVSTICSDAFITATLEAFVVIVLVTCIGYIAINACRAILYIICTVDFFSMLWWLKRILPGFIVVRLLIVIVTRPEDWPKVLAEDLAERIVTYPNHLAVSVCVFVALALFFFLLSLPSRLLLRAWRADLPFFATAVTVAVLYAFTGYWFLHDPRLFQAILYCMFFDVFWTPIYFLQHVLGMDLTFVLKLSSIFVELCQRCSFTAYSTLVLLLLVTILLILTPLRLLYRFMDTLCYLVFGKGVN